MTEPIHSWSFSEELINEERSARGWGSSQGSGYSNVPQNLSDKRRELMTKGSWWGWESICAGEMRINFVLYFKIQCGCTWKVNVWISCSQRARCWNYNFGASSTIWGNILESRGKPWASFLSGRKVSLEMQRYKNLKMVVLQQRGKKDKHIQSFWQYLKLKSLVF